MKDDMGKGKGYGDSGGKGYAGQPDSRPSSDRGWTPPQGLPDTPGKAEKIPRPK